jgi:two-component system response regulator FixJ
MSALEGPVFIVDDDEDIRTALTRALTTRGFEVSSFASAQAFIDAHDPDTGGCLLLDYGMPGMNGLELQALLKQQGRDIPVIFITGHGGVPESVQAMKLGAVDFLEKPFRQETLMESIKTALQADAANQARRARTREAKRRFATLTDREKEIAELLVSDTSSTSSKQVARTLDISPRTVDHHRARILEKMQVSSVAQLIDLSLTTKLFS